MAGVGCVSATGAGWASATGSIDTRPNVNRATGDVSQWPVSQSGSWVTSSRQATRRLADTVCRSGPASAKMKIPR
ncbi:hypothetical protein GCM10012279_23130 [Micromonospora yangpuensis]|nr:hypothetical protein GCM10012279_23130 [Micromonospora yangpuensis]